MSQPLPTRDRRPQPRKRANPATRRIAIVAVILCTALAVWLGNTSLPRVTHAEALAMAATIEQTNDLRVVQQFVHFPDAPKGSLDPADPGDGARALADMVFATKSRGSYTFINMGAGGKEQPSLVFRCERDGVLVDYHELRLERCGDEAKVTDVWSLVSGGWMRETLAERQALLDAEETATEVLPFLRDLPTRNAAQRQTAFRALSPRVRHSLLVGLAHLRLLDPKDVERFHPAIAEFRLAHPENLAPDGFILCAGSTLGIPRHEIESAIYRIHARVNDDEFLGRVQKSLGR